MKEDAKFAVGIDLGTTNSVLAAVELKKCDREIAPVEVIEIPQLVAPGKVEGRGQLPSFLYLPHEAELPPEDRVLPWNERVERLVGVLARQLGSKTPIRLVASAKSWLCHAGVDPKRPFLPLEAPEEVPRISPYEATVEYLKHIRDAWDHLHPEDPLSEQELIITVPASFDPAARELTYQAAQELGLGHAVLAEEPQAAFYSWIQQSGGKWREQVSVGDLVLVVDVGGGTTDLTLIAVTEEDGNLQLSRIAVGEHILLGGDNMDLALAFLVKSKLEKEGKKLDHWQVQALTHSCREAKEQLLSDPSLSAVPVVVPSRGSKLIGGTLRAELTRDEVQRVLVDGFFPHIPVDTKPVKRPRTGLTTLGLPYAQDPRMTAHIAHFLTIQKEATSDLEGFELPENARFIRPSAILLNGGVFKAEVLAQRLLEVINRWLEEEGAPKARLLEGNDLDFAVARGASYYCYVRRGGGVRIRGGTAAAYYVGVESTLPAVPGFPAPLRLLCVAPFGMEEGTEAPLPDYEFGVVVGEPVRFKFFASKVRRHDRVGTILEDWSEDGIEELDEIEVVLPPGEKHRPGDIVPVQLRAAYTETGTLRLEAIAKDTNERWKVEFEVRAKEQELLTETAEDVPLPEEEVSQKVLEELEEAPPSAEEPAETLKEEAAPEPEPGVQEEEKEKKVPPEAVTSEVSQEAPKAEEKKEEKGKKKGLFGLFKK